MVIYVLKSIFHNISVVFVGFAFAFIGTRLDAFLGITGFHSLLAVIAGSLLLAFGFFLRVWATLYFYREQMKVISLVPQKRLITSSPYRFSIHTIT